MILRRILTSFPLIIAMVMVNFSIIHLAPGDPVKILVSSQESTPLPAGYLDKVRAEYGLDKPIHEQLIIYLGKVILRGDLGYSFYTRRPIMDSILSRLPNTLILMFTSLILSVIVGILIGTKCASNPYSKTDTIGTILSLIFWSMPYFWMGMVALLLFSYLIPLFPVGGSMSFGVEGFVNIILDRLWHLVLPVACLTLGTTAIYSRFTRSSMLEVLNEDYIVTAWSKGCDESRVLHYHAFRNALLPLVTLIGLRIREVFMGSVLVETIFNWPGLGQLLYSSITMRDYNLILGMFFIYSILTVIFNLIADISYAIVDPRIRYRKAQM